jgi:hypothetical protein
MSKDRGTAGHEPSLKELGAEARYAADRLALYRRKIFAGQGRTARLEELERVAAGSEKRLRVAVARSPKSEETS